MKFDTVHILLEMSLLTLAGIVAYLITSEREKHWTKLICTGK